MENKLKTPLLQSAAVVCAVIVLVLVIGTSGSTSAGGGIVALFSAIGNAILFVIGMAIALALTIAILVGIFLAAVAMVDSAEASRMYDGLKKNFSASLLALSCNSCDDNKANSGVSEEEYAAMKEELTLLQEKNSQLTGQLNTLTSDNDSLKANISALGSNNSALKEKIDELSGTVQELQESEAKINGILSDLSEKIEASNDKELKNQMAQLEKLQAETKSEIEAISQRVEAMEASAQAETPADETSSSNATGIFSYIEKEEDQALFVEKIEEAVILEMTYAQIDEHLTESLPPELDKIVKDHPSLTKDYIRSVRS